jgi:hypothetical protein
VVPNANFAEPYAQYPQPQQSISIIGGYVARNTQNIAAIQANAAQLGEGVNTKIWYRKESDLWAQLGEKIRPGEGRFLQEDSAKELAVGSLLSFGRGTVCADFAGLRDDVARAEGTNGWISDRT